MTIERARRFARAYLDEFGPKGEFDVCMPSELELEMVAAVFEKELECTVSYTKGAESIRVQMPWFKFMEPAAAASPYLS